MRKSDFLLWFLGVARSAHRRPGAKPRTQPGPELQEPTFNLAAARSSVTQIIRNLLAEFRIILCRNAATACRKRILPTTLVTAQRSGTGSRR
jgi:hypothetical protein